MRNVSRDEKNKGNILDWKSPTRYVGISFTSLIYSESCNSDILSKAGRCFTHPYHNLGWGEDLIKEMMVQCLLSASKFTDIVLNWNS